MEYDPVTFWDRKFRESGTTGISDELLNRYNQPLRLKAVAGALRATGIKLNSLSVLDVGCGVGVFLEEFLKLGAKVTGIDISSEAIKRCRERFGALAVLKVQKVEEIDFPPGSFDFVSSIAVCQHIVDDGLFESAVGKLAEVVKPGGFILFMERAPERAGQRRLCSYLMNRPKSEQAALFKEKNCLLIYDKGYPMLGITIVERYFQLLGSLSRFLPGSVSRRAGQLIKQEKKKREQAYPGDDGSANPSLLYKVYRMGEELLLTLAYPFDHLLSLSLTGRRSAVRCMIFRKTGL